ncbi:hypothetical protein NDU88_009559 [Pleurodeles waltl]|uniref:Uncharacterized protein n=1 Tax=Pleurodeles waltl TaxID=8319 RepID=A0AAV7QXW1_PLEWA|nr:hypothetical protein NDU88_009559 [Pleurodeles waltl]
MEAEYPRTPSEGQELWEISTGSTQQRPCGEGSGALHPYIGKGQVPLSFETLALVPTAHKTAEVERRSTASRDKPEWGEPHYTPVMTSDR